MAEAIARRMAAARGLDDIVVSSAGTSAWEGAPASDGALLVAMEHGVDLNAHRARVLSREIVTGADLILVMGPHHLERAQALGGDGRAHLLAAYASRDVNAEAIADPFGGELEHYRQTFVDLERTIALTLDRVVAERGTGGA